MKTRALLVGSVFVLGMHLLACSGGGGAYDDGIVTQDPVSHSNEGVSSSQESSGQTNEGIAKTGERPGANGVESSPASGGGAIDCSAKYSCAVTTGGKTRSSTIRFKNGACVDDDTALSPDGTVTDNGVAVGTWHATANGFTLTATVTTKDGAATYDFDCTKTSDTGNSGTGSVPDTDAGTK